jgi:hypothetical protein
VGFEQSDGATLGHHAYHLNLADGATLRMQVNGTAADQFDSITATGNVALNGTLEILVNPFASSGTNPFYSPTVGDMFTIINIGAVPLAADFNDSGAVDGADLDVWETAFGSTAGGDADGDGDSDGADFLAWQSGFGATGGVTGAISGTFDNVVVNGMPGGFAFQVVYSATEVKLQVVAAAAAVPEPSALALAAGFAAAGLVMRRRS